MTNADFIAWHKRMRYTYESGQAALGVSRATYANMLTGVTATTGKPFAYSLQLAHACANIEHGRKPLGHPVYSIPTLPAA